AVELRLGKIRRSFAEDLVRPLQLAVLPLELLQTLLLACRQARPLPCVALCLPYPRQQSLRGAAHLPGDGRDRRPLRRVLVLLLHHQPDRSLTNLSRVLARSAHAPILSRKGASEKPGAIQCALQELLRQVTGAAICERVADVVTGLVSGPERPYEPR